MKRLLSLLFIFLCACTPHQEAELSYGNSPAYSSSNYPTKWTRGFPLTLNISEDFEQDEIDAIALAGNNWEDSLSNQVNFFNMSSNQFTSKSSLASYNDGFYGVYKNYNWPSELPSTALAVTQINGTQFPGFIRIDQADILLNYDYYTFSSDGSWGYDLTTVVLHEMGHFLGLYHDKSSQEDSVMYPTIGRFSTNQNPKSNDIDNLAQKYQVTQTRSLASQSTNEQGKPVVIQLELYPKKEIIKINGVKHEIHHH